MKRKGFTLIELVLAMSVLVVGLVGVVAVVPMGQKSARDAAEITKAANVASEKLSEIRAFGYDEIAASVPPFPLSGAKDGVEWAVEIRDALDSDFELLIERPVTDFKKITLTIIYQINRKPRTETFHTFVTRF